MQNISIACQLTCQLSYSVVEFASSSDLKSALDKLDGSELNGRRIKLIEDRKRRRYIFLIRIVGDGPAINYLICLELLLSKVVQLDQGGPTRGLLAEAFFGSP